MLAFRNREDALAQICVPMEQAVLLNIYGEAGIGKSRLLREAARQLRAKSLPALVLYVDLEPLAKTPANRPEALMRALIAQSEGRLSVVWKNVEYVAGQTVAQLTELAGRMPVVLMFDTTEVLQEDMEFWRWMEANLVGHLVSDGRVRQVFAGRVPVPWRRVEARRTTKLVPLKPLPPQDAARDLIQEVLQQHNPRLKGQELDQVIDVVLDFSFGHPLLSEELAAYVALRWPAPSSAEFKRELGRELVKPFIEQHFFADIEHPWDEILWLISALDWFDATVLQRFLARAAPDLAPGQPDYFFIQGITRLRVRNTVVWREKQGDRLHGVIASIVRHCFEVIDPERYQKACQAAAETFDALAGEFPDGFDEAQQYHQEAEKYRQRAKQEAEQ